MATSKTNAVPVADTSEYCVYDSSHENHSLGDTVFSRSIEATTQKLLSTTIAQLKGFGFSRYTVRVFYKPTGYSDIARNTLRFEFAVVGAPTPGKPSQALVAYANGMAEESPSPTV